VEDVVFFGLKVLNVIISQLFLMNKKWGIQFSFAEKIVTDAALNHIFISRQGGESEAFSKRAIESLVKKLKVTFSLNLK